MANNHKRVFLFVLAWVLFFVPVLIGAFAPFQIFTKCVIYFFGELSGLFVIMQALSIEKTINEGVVRSNRLTKL